MIQCPREKLLLLFDETEIGKALRWSDNETFNPEWRFTLSRTILSSDDDNKDSWKR